MENEKPANETQEKTPAAAAPADANSEKSAENSAPENAAVPANENSADIPADDVPATKPRCRCRALKIVLAVVVLLILALVIVVGFFLGPIVRGSVNAFGASILGVDKCEIGAAKIYPFTGYVRFEKILIGKPLAADCEFSGNVLELELAEIDVDVFSLLSRKKTLERLEVRNVTANYEQLLSGKTNIEVLVDNTLGEGSFAQMTAGENAENADAGTAAAADDAAGTEEEEIFVAAHYFVIENANAGANIRGVPVVLPPFSSDFSGGIGVEEDLTPGDFVTKIAGDYVDVLRLSALGGVVTDAAGATVDAVGDAAGATVDIASDAAGATVDAVGDAAGATAELASDAAGATVDAVGDAAGAAADAVSGAAGAVLDIFGGSDEKKSDE